MEKEAQLCLSMYIIRFIFFQNSYIKYIYRRNDMTNNRLISYNPTILNIIINGDKLLL